MRLIGRNRTLQLQVFLGAEPASQELSAKLRRARDVWVEALRFLVSFHRRDSRLTGLGETSEAKGIVG